MTLLIAAGVLFAVATTIVFGVNAAEQIGGWWGRRQARRTVHTEERRTNLGPPPGVPDRRRTDVGPSGRHRREDAHTASFSATAVLRRIKAEADELPKVGRN